MRLGAHVSVAGGLQNAIPWALEIEADTFQMFSKNQRQWIAKPLTDEEIEAFKTPLSQTELGPLMIHDSYLINMGSPDETKGKRAQVAFLEEYHRDIFYAANVFFDKALDENNGKRERYSLKKEISINMNGKVRIIGVCIETRPDAITPEWIRFFRRSGTTRIQLGVQHNNNRILKKINRGHTFEDSCDAVELLRNNCFKVDIHLMPDLLADLHVY